VLEASCQFETAARKLLVSHLSSILTALKPLSTRGDMEDKWQCVEEFGGELPSERSQVGQAAS